MEQFNVMPPVDPNPNQPMHQPEGVAQNSAANPGSPQSPISPMTPLSNPLTPPGGAPPITPNMTGKEPGRLKRIFSKFKLRYVLILVGVLILGLLVVGYIIVGRGKTALGQKLQDNLWQKMIDNSKDLTKDMDLKVTYTDSGSYDFKPSKFIGPYSSMLQPGEMDEIDKQYSFTISDLSMGGKLHTYVEASNKEVPKLDFQVDGNFTNNKKTYEGSYAMKLLEKEYYSKHDYNGSFEELRDKNRIYASYPDPSKNIWIQTTDEDSVRNLRDDLRDLMELKTPDKKDEEAEAYKKLLREHRFFDIKSLKGISLRGGKPVLHYTLSLNKDKFRDLTNKSLDKSLPGDSGKEIKDFIREINDIILEKIDSSEYEVWVGVIDHRIYETKLNIAALSVTKSMDTFEKILNDPNNDLTKNIAESMEIANAQSRDAKRIAEMRSMASALELYFNDHSSYPESKDGQPVGISPQYVELIPTAPTPADGDCDDWHNAYWYTKTSATTYTYTFCIGEQMEGFGAGNIALTQNGIQSERSFDPSKQSNDTYYDTNPDQYMESIKKSVLETIRNLNFDARILVEYTAKDFGKVKEITAPTDFKKQEDIIVNFPQDEEYYPECRTVTDVRCVDGQPVEPYDAPQVNPAN